MIIDGIDVSDELLAKYVEIVRHTIERSNTLPSGVHIPMDDEERRAFHDIILASVRQSRGSPFSRALNDYVDGIAEKEGWFDCC